MEIIVFGLIFTPLTLAFCFMAFKELLRELKSGEPKKLLTQGKTIQFSCSISSEDKKNEVCATNTNSNKSDLD